MRKGECLVSSLAGSLKKARNHDTEVKILDVWNMFCGIDVADESYSTAHSGRMNGQSIGTMPAKCPNVPAREANSVLDAIGFAINFDAWSLAFASFGAVIVVST